MSHSLKNIPDPDPRILRLQFAVQAKAGQIKATGCTHPISAVQQYIDDMGYRTRDGRPTNLFLCTICKTHLRLLGYDNVEAADG